MSPPLCVEVCSHFVQSGTVVCDRSRKNKDILMQVIQVCVHFHMYACTRPVRNSTISILDLVMHSLHLRFIWSLPAMARTEATEYSSRTEGCLRDCLSICDVCILLQNFIKYSGFPKGIHHRIPYISLFSINVAQPQLRYHRDVSCLVEVIQHRKVAEQLGGCLRDCSRYAA